MTEEKKSCDSCESTQGQPSGFQEFLEQEALKDRMEKVKHKILVLSGKGGVGKSTVATNLAVALSKAGKAVGLLDVDFHGPSIPTLLNLEGKPVYQHDEGLIPVEFASGIKVMSVGFLLRDQDEAVIWRGPMKISFLKQLLKDVIWGDLDYLVIDFPPGTGDEPLSIAQMIPECDGAVIVTTPQNLSLNDVKKSINFCRRIKIPVLGVIENMSGLMCPHCGQMIDLFKSGGGEAMANKMDVPFLGRIPIDPRVVEASDLGEPFIERHADSEGAAAFARIVQQLIDLKA
ncbi:MAG: Mrp/NBP35 family ATP-binding protein [Syntrophales bacterium]|jgi:Mrp family chromosome partitioning ATPase|nr:Mrp/NBP35 family ATP-binding protein [Syntrophales bacterium]